MIIVLPLGTLVAQRLASPAWFGTGPGGGGGAVDSSAHSASGGGGGGYGGYGCASANTTGTGTGTGSVLSRGGLSGVTATSTASRRPLLTSVRSNTSVGGGVHRGRGAAGVETRIIAAGAGSEGSFGEEKGYAQGVDGGLAAAGRQDLEGGGVRVDYGIERREERLPTASGGS